MNAQDNRIIVSQWVNPSLSLFVSVDGAPNRVSITPPCSVNGLLLVGPSVDYSCVCVLLFSGRIAPLIGLHGFCIELSYLWPVLDCHGITFCCFWLLYFLLDWFFCTFIVQMGESFSILHHFHRNCPFMDLIHKTIIVRSTGLLFISHVKTNIRGTIGIW